jgi:hypothetical protein
MFSRSVACFLFTASLMFAPLSQAADLDVAAPISEAQPAEAAVDYLDRLAVVLMIRSSFDVVAVEDVAGLLLDAAEGIGIEVSAEASETLDQQLLTEGGYYLVSLRYLALSGGAAWPEDRSEGSYVRDAVLELEGLEAALVTSVRERRDPLPILLEAQRIRALTEGYPEVPEALQRFAGRDELVTAALAAVQKD